MVNQILNDDPGSAFLNELKGGNLQKCAENVISLAATLNSLQYQNSSNSSTSTSVSSSTNSTNGTSEALSAAEIQRNTQSRGREALLNNIQKVSQSDVSSIKLFSSMLSVVTKRFEENSRTIAVNFVHLNNKLSFYSGKIRIYLKENSISTANELITKLNTELANSVDMDDVVQISGGIFDAVANSLIVLSSYFS